MTSDFKKGRWLDAPSVGTGCDQFAGSRGTWKERGMAVPLGSRGLVVDSAESGAHGAHEAVRMAVTKELHPGAAEGGGGQKTPALTRWCAQVRHHKIPVQRMNQRMKRSEINPNKESE